MNNPGQAILFLMDEGLDIVVKFHYYRNVVVLLHPQENNCVLSFLYFRG
jgi:hypothetical protein